MFTAYQSLFSYLAPAPDSTLPEIEDQSLFSRLPYELREQIYTYLFADHAYSSLYISPESRSVLSTPVIEGTHHTALLRTCKAIHAEALPIMHATHDVHLLVSGSPALQRRPRSIDSVTNIFHGETYVCSQRSMLQLIQDRITRVSITVRLNGISSNEPVIQKLAWLIKILRQREKRLESLTLHLYIDLKAFSGCCEMTEDIMGWRWYVHPQTVMVERSPDGGHAGHAGPENELLGNCADQWKVAVSMNEARLRMRQKPEHFWRSTVEALEGVESVLREKEIWWNKWNPTEAWADICQRIVG